MHATGRIQKKLFCAAILATVLFATTATLSGATSCVAASTTWTNVPLSSTEKGSFQITFDATPSVADIDAVTGLSYGPATGYTSLAAIVRFNNTGTIDARSGANYVAATAIPYTAGVTYHFILNVDLSTHTYDAYVMIGSVQTKIGSGLAFRSEQATVSALNNVGALSSTGSETLCSVAVAVAPAITTQPASQTVTAGQTATFRVAATGATPLTYQWKKNGTAISGATSSTYTTPATTTADSGTSYTVVVSNSFGSVTSTAATLTVTASTSSCAVASSSWLNSALPVTEKGSFQITFDAMPSVADIDAVTGLSYGPATGYTSLAAIVRFNNTGTIDARSGANYVAATAIPYTAGVTYHFILNVDISTHTYNAYVMIGSVQTTIGSGLAFRTEQATVSALNNVGALSSTGSETLCNIALPAAPSVVAPAITTQPASKTVTAGQTATFTVAATGTTPLTYQWKKNGTAISGATSSIYTTPATTTSDSNSQFTVVVSNSAGSVTSAAAILTVNASAVAPTITTQPASKTVTAGQTATFTVAASGTSPLSYQWKKNGTAISGATSSTYTTPATTTADSGTSYTVVVSNSAGSVTSAAATLTVTASSCAVASSSWLNSVLPVTETGSFQITFNATPSVPDIDAVTGLSYGPATGYTSLAAIVRFNNTGTIDARSGANYVAATAIPYTAGVTYHFILNVSISTHTYNAYVMIGSVQTTIGTGLAFRSEQATVSALNNVGALSSTGSETLCNITLASTAVATAGPLNDSPTSLSFGSVTESTSSTQSVKLTNSGSANVTISNVSISGAGFAASGVSTGEILAPGQTASLSVTFTPSTTGTLTGGVTVSSNASNSPDTIALSGSGVAPVSYSVSLTWVASTSSSVTGYNCYFSTTSGGPYTKLTPTPIATTTYSDTAVQAGKTYYYVVTSVNSSNVESAYSAQVSATVP